MRGVIGGNNINAPIQDCGEDGFPIRRAFNRRIPFDQCTEPSIITVVKPEVVNTGFGRDTFFFQGSCVVEQAGLARSGDV